MTELEYRQRLDALLKEDNFSHLSDGFGEKLDALAADLKEMIKNNAEDLTNEGGRTVYVSSDGNDEADGLSADTAIKTIDKLNSMEFGTGELVVFRRGDLFRGSVTARSGVSYGAYGSGPKPKIYMAWEASDLGEWKKTDKENIWVLDAKLPDKDVGILLFNDGIGEIYAEKQSSLENITHNLDFCYDCELTNKENPENRIYLRCDEGNPAEVFWQIDISRKGSIIFMNHCSHDITVRNLELRFAQDIFFVNRSKNIHASYLDCGWTGGMYYNSDFLRYGGGAGGWHSCDGYTFDHCYIYQQLDSGVTPQYICKDEDAGVFEGFKTTDCLFETCEWAFEYYHSQRNLVGNCFKNFLFKYNICRTGGQGIGVQRSQSRIDESAYVKTWGHENVLFNCEISHNIFDRAAALSLEIISHDHGKSGYDVSYDHLPKLCNNIYIEPKDKKWANINRIFYTFNEACPITLERLGVDKDSLYIYAN